MLHIKAKTLQFSSCSSVLAELVVYYLALAFKEFFFCGIIILLHIIASDESLGRNGLLCF